MVAQPTLFGGEEPITMRGVRWSDAEDVRLSELWGVWGIERISAELGREPSSVRAHAMAIGLPGGMPSGYETFASAARRNGVHTRDVIRAKWLFNVPTAVSLSWIPGERKVRYVDACMVDDAIEKWRSAPKVRRHSVTRAMRESNYSEIPDSSNC